MARIVIDGDIASYGISSALIRDQVDAIPSGEKIEIVIASAGGSVYEGVAIFNIIRAAAKNHAISVLIQGLAASMASYIALAAKLADPSSTIQVEDNSVYVIHNPYAIAVGDYRAFEKIGTLLGRFAALLAVTYSAISKKGNKEIRSLMDEETYFIGREIVDAGFADEVVASASGAGGGSGNPSDAMISEASALIASAKIAIEKTKMNLEQNKEPDDIEKAVALLDPTAGRPTAPAARNTDPAVAGMEERMNPEELLAKFPDCYKAVLAKGVEQERKRADAHLKMGEAAGSLEISAKYIRDGSGLGDDTVIADYQALAMKNRMITARKDDDPPGGNHKDSKDGKDLILAALDKEIGGEK